MSYAVACTRYYCGVDLHGRTSFVCVKDRQGRTKLHREFGNDGAEMMAALKPYVGSLSVCCESTYNWYWLESLCRAHGIAFYLGHALYIKHISSSKQKNDRIDSRKLADLLRTGMLPLAYPYPEQMRATRDLLRRRLVLVQQRGGYYSHVRTILAQEGVPPLPVNYLQTRKNRAGVPSMLSDPEHVDSVSTDLQLVESLERAIKHLDDKVAENAKVHDRRNFELLMTVPGLGEGMALVILYEVCTISRFKTPQQFSSYARVVRVKHDSAGKAVGGERNKIGNPYLRWAFHEVAVHAPMFSKPIKAHYDKLRSRCGGRKAQAVLAHKFAVAVWMMLKHGTGFDEKLFLAHT